MKIQLTFLGLLLSLGCLSASESGLIQTFQPLDGFGSGEPEVTPVTCYAYHAHAGWTQAFLYLSAPYVPPTHSASPGDINLASVSGLVVGADEEAEGRSTVSLDFTAFKPARGYPGAEIVEATLECLRRIGGNKLAGMSIDAKYRATGQEDLKKLVDAFAKEVKDKQSRKGQRQAGAEEKRVPVLTDSLNTTHQLIGPIGKPVGEVVTLDITIEEDEFKRAFKDYVNVTSVEGVELSKPVKMSARLWTWANFPKLEPGRTMKVRAYQDAGMIGVPRQAMRETVDVQDVPHQFSTWLMIINEVRQ